MIINQIMLYLLIALTAALLLRGVWRRQDMLRFPFLAAAVMAGWFIPQAIGLSNNEFLPEGGYALTMFVALLGLGATVPGERLVAARAPTRIYEYDQRIMLGASVILSVMGLCAEFMVVHTNIEIADNGGATGIGSIYFFVMQVQVYGLALGLLLLLQRFSFVSLAVVCIDLFNYGGFILFGGRRGLAVEVGLVIASAFWFQRRRLPSHGVALAVIVCATLLVNSIAEYRQLVSKINESEHRLPTIDEIMGIDFIGRINKETTEGSFEVSNAIYYIAAAQETGQFDFGLSYWNYFVFRYVPAQFVTRSVKDALTVDLQNNAATVYGYKRWIGTTFTGFADSFSSFWLFGALVFAFIAAILQRWWRDAMFGDLQAKLLYCVTISSATTAISHGTQWFLVYLPQVFMFTLPFFYWARKPPRRASSVREQYQARSRARSVSF